MANNIPICLLKNLIQQQAINTKGTAVIHLSLIAKSTTVDFQLLLSIYTAIFCPIPQITNYGTADHGFGILVQGLWDSTGGYGSLALPLTRQ